ncbi:response regulator transcription factor [Kocuria sp. p3-SID1433]|uniref:response regulator n=1 Tax=unclassified Kocuria TaxID=2649579 RepID=UPI0021A29717|nr:MULTISPECIES: response regulator transcription factor [unclassified Kocuria]MCT1601013.1 response regulator transcription factor [Kocuria sp. p3-SID1428]MCT2180872.1 response regulator transcription factor [Kocuria sp. p3-SID1433]
MTTVVLADDHAAIRAGVRMILETAQPPLRVVGEASTAHDAVEIAQRTRPDVVLLDVRMPGASGLTAIEALRGTGAEVIMLTSFALDDYVLAALRAGAAGFLVKTAEPSEIIAAVQRVAAGDAALSPEVMRTVIDRAIAKPGESARAQELQHPEVPSAAVAAQAVFEDPTAAPSSGVSESPGTSGTLGPSEPLTAREREVLRLLAQGLSNQQIAARLVVAESTVKTHVSHVLAKLGAASRVQAALWWGRHGRG